MARLAFLTPDTLEGSLECSGLDIPANLFRYVAGALAELTVVENWELHGEVTPEEAADYFNELLLNTQWGLCTMPAMHERVLVTNLTVATSSVTVVEMGVGSLDSEFLSYDEGQVTALKNLWVTVTLNSEWQANSLGSRRLELRRDGTAVARAQFQASGAGVTAVPLAWQGALSQGSVLEYIVFQNSGDDRVLAGNGLSRWAITGFRTS